MSNFVSPCPSCPRAYRAVGGDGPRPARILCVGERPGDNENKFGRVFCGKTGDEFNDLYLPLAGLRRSEVRVCNTVLCGADNNKAPTDKEIARCSEFHIPDEINKTNPDIIILMGATACSLAPGIRLDMHHGIPQHTDKVGEIFGWSGIVIPMYHPSMGLHESRWMQMIIEDWNGCRGFDDISFDPPQPEVRYEKLHGEIAGMHKRIAIDTESHGSKPYSIQWSGYKGTGYLIFADDYRAVGKLAAWIEEEETEVIFHNASYDLEVLRQLGIRVTRFRDTMQEAFHLGNLPQGLKALSYRLFRHTMTSYEEVVWPASISALQTWMLEAVQIAEADLSFVEHKKLKTKVKEIVHKGELESLLRRLLRNTDTASEYNPWGTDKEPRLAAFWNDPANEWMLPHIESRIGPYPLLGIANCSMQEAIRYAVGDADWTGRVAVELARRRKEAFQIYEGDKDL